MDFFSGAGKQCWETEQILKFERDFPSVKALKLTQGKHLHDFYKFTEAMNEAVDLGVASKDDLSPDVSAALRRRNTKYAEILKARAESMASSDDIGASKASDLETYSLARGEATNLELFERMIAQRKLGSADLPSVFASLDVACSQSQLELLAPSEEEVRLGDELKKTNSVSGRRIYASTRLGKLGTLEGSCRESNGERRMMNMERREQVDVSIRDLLAIKQKNKEDRQEEKTREAEEQRKKAEVRQAKKLQGTPSPPMYNASQLLP